MENQTLFLTNTTSKNDVHDNTSLTFLPATAIPITTTTEITNATDINTCADAMDIYESANLFQKYFLPCLCIVGIPGNLFSFLVWIRPRMRNSSGVYLAALAMVHFLFLVLYLIYNFETSWEIRMLSFHGICELFPVLYYFLQYMDPLLVSAFSVERYISICHPFKRIHYCTKKRACIVTSALAVFSFSLSGVQGYFWTYEDDACFVRKEVLVGKESSLWQVWAIITELLSFLVVPLFVLVLNIRLLYHISYERRSDICAPEIHHTTKKSSAHTIVLLYVSFYFILTMFPVSIVYLLQLYFKSQQNCTVIYFYVIKMIIEIIGQTHFALNFYIYLTTGSVFREETKRLIRIKKTRNNDIYTT